jgi:TonB family protein
VISKPTPAYTEAARALKLEGEVLLEVQFRATGQVRVLRVVRGLDYGLDEAATHAAERIQFKPARNRSGPVDFQTTVSITFRLT